MMTLTPLVIALLLGCSGSDIDTTGADCLRPLDWRDAQQVGADGVASVVVVEDCENDLQITSVELIGAGWDGDLPNVGDLIPAGTWTITVFHTGADHPGTYTGELSVEAEGLDPEPSKPLQFVIEGDTGDTGG